MFEFFKIGIKFITVMTTKKSCPYCSSEFDSSAELSKHIDRIHHGSGLLEGDTRKF